MRLGLWIGLLFPLTQTACLITIAGKQLEPIEPPQPALRASLEQTVGDFEFTLDGGKMITSNKAGRDLNEQLLKRWKRDGYIDRYTYVPTSNFSSTARYRLTLSGSQYGESSLILQLLSGLTLYVIPHFIDTKYDIQFTLEDSVSGKRYSASVQDNTLVWWELLLLLALPVASSGADHTYDVMADHLYDQLRSQGAFDAGAHGPTEVPEIPTEPVVPSS